MKIIGLLEMKIMSRLGNENLETKMKIKNENLDQTVPF
jgi:hypothetical protein